MRAAYELHCAAVVLLALVDQPLHGEVDVGLVADGVYGGHLVRVKVRVRVRVRVGLGLGLGASGLLLRSLQAASYVRSA